VRAAVATRDGPPEVVRLADVAEPVPRADELLVRVTGPVDHRGERALVDQVVGAYRFVDTGQKTGNVVLTRG
jgi:hypothetical protein